MNNPFKAHLPEIVFDLQSPTVTEVQISQWRAALKKEQTRLSVMIRFTGLFMIVAAVITVWAVSTTDAIIQFFLTVAVGAAAIFLIHGVFPDREDCKGVIRALARLNPLEATAEPEKYISLAQWCAQDAVLAAYQKGWTEQKRLPVAREYAVMKWWVEGAEGRMKKARMVEQAYAARETLTGMSIQT